MRHGATHELVVLLEAVGEAGDARYKELARRVGLARVEEVKPCVSAHGPVVVLAGAVDARKGLLVEEHDQAELGGLRGAHLHEEHVVVRGEGGLAVDGRHLVLRRRDLVVHHGHGNPELQHHCLDVEEQLRHGVGHGREVVEVGLLVARRQRAHERAPAVHEVRPCTVVLRLDDEELLLPAEEGVDGLGVRADLDRLQQPQALPVHGIIGAKQRCLVVDASAEVRDEAARDAEDLVHDEAGRRAVPSCEGRGRVCRAEAAVGEGRAVRLAEEEPLIGQRRLEGFRGLLGGPLKVDERVHLEGAHGAPKGAATEAHGEEPVREGDGPEAARPLEHCVRDGLHVLLARGSARDESLLEAAVHGARQRGLHGLVVKDQARDLRQLILGAGGLREHLGSGGRREHPGDGCEGMQRWAKWA
mmetsp:Transcript_77703/g.116855  ORF Transcript_77703/g.116855 Transcript_77703/m.116855 type:complete len:416 (-) Transcript_77703:24-1271(-)